MSKLMNQASTATVEVELANSATSTVSIATFVGRGGIIPDGMGSFQDEIVVADNFKVSSVTVTLNDLEHTWVGDIVVRLRHIETGTVVDLLRRPGQPQFSSSGYSSDLNGNYSFSDTFKGNFDAVAAENDVIPSGSYAPLQPLSVLKGLSSAGSWQLIVNDCSAGDSGSLGSWSLELV
ncbi:MULTISPECIES: proprotein convertase P-domain-containing protein [unclassified Coleofasciculus]|uniref:proprotein convertase P-domain-containing protein n=1 Tax=unclassified Coleofasciculus TaxID=2692782 RepID=UPI001880E0DA|nr:MULTISPECIES: proprotein convertase P-domain-containing protein [unclassified Coleofasciculus]MBE9124614.1 proprotein convertase P-domain-containing protein [Coleofasciculus sp. LEGE 07081]MBE9147578.1 proprotein convertase P-domain-containing protein [Coleofasciculus sp. LEGE 07092]